MNDRDKAIQSLPPSITMPLGRILFPMRHMCSSHSTNVLSSPCLWMKWWTSRPCDFTKLRFRLDDRNATNSLLVLKQSNSRNYRQILTNGIHSESGEDYLMGKSDSLKLITKSQSHDDWINSDMDSSNMVSRDAPPQMLLWRLRDNNTLFSFSSRGSNSRNR